METIGNRIAKLRDIMAEETGHCTQQDLANYVGVEKNQIYKWEHDLVSVNVEKVEMLSKYFNVSCDYLIRGGSPEHLQLMDKTGLSHETISILSSWKEHGKYRFVSQTIDQLVKHPIFLMGVYDYLNTDFPEEDITDHPIFHGYQERISRIFVMDQLKQLREEIQNGKS